MKRSVQSIPNGIPVLQMMVRVSDGSYESKLEIPVTSTKEQIEQIAQMWIGALAQAIQITREHREPSGGVKS